LPTEVTAEQIKQVCDGVWRDRAAILECRGFASGEEALVGAAYWRLCNAGQRPGSSIAGCAPFLRELIRRYRAEAL
jgi:hypothetical protein